MYSFEGNYKRTPVQSLGGSSSKKEDKLTLLRRNQEERRKREQLRKQTLSCITIQAFSRSCKARHRVKESCRTKFDHMILEIQKGCLQLSITTNVANVLRLLIFFYHESQDKERLITLCTSLLKNQSILTTYFTTVKDNVACFHLNRFMDICCRHIELISNSSERLAPVLRIIEVITDIKNENQQSHLMLDQLFSTKFSKTWYSMCNSLLTFRIPSSLDEETMQPPVPLAQLVLDLINKPLGIASSQQCWKCVMESLCFNLFCKPFTPQLYYYILPCMISQNSSNIFKLLLNIITLNARNTESESVDNIMNISIPQNIWLLCTLLKFADKNLDSLQDSELHKYLLVLHSCNNELTVFETSINQQYKDVDSDSDVEMDDVDVEMTVSNEGIVQLNPTFIQEECLVLLDRRYHVHGVVKALERSQNVDAIRAVCAVCHTLLVKKKLHINQARLLYTLAFNPTFLRNLWLCCKTVSTEMLTGSSASLLQMLSRGIQMSHDALYRIVPLLSVFCAFFSHSLVTLHDAEFHGRVELWDAEQNNTNKDNLWTMPFNLQELIKMSQSLKDACLGIIELAHPETKPFLRENYREAFSSISSKVNQSITVEELHGRRNTWANLFRLTSQLVRQLHERDCRRRFCPDDHWLSDKIVLNVDKRSQLFTLPQVFEPRSFGAMSTLNPHRHEQDLPLLTTLETRQLTVLTEIPFVLPFPHRVKIFSRLVDQDHGVYQGEMQYLQPQGSIHIMIRRNYLYEDAFEKLSLENEPNLKKRIQVVLKNFAGLDEAGIDGGGLFREFMWELLQAAFNPNRGLFCATTDRLLYPNPQVRILYENYRDHYYFLGRMLGKALFEGMLVDLPFASFFLSKILSRHGGDVDIHHLESLDPEMYKNLLFLKSYTGDVSALDLDFTVVNNDFGEAQVVELKPGGSEIPVDNSNRIEYIHRMAHYRLNRQIRVQCDSFCQGISDVVNREWLHMFDHRELQILLSGAHVPIDIDDLRRHTNYSGGYHEDHPVILNFWSAVRQFTDDQRQALLKFVTSCRRPPLLGFKDLHPAFCIHYGGKEADRLPSASTCMNLLKLPEFKSEQSLRTKLIYAIESGTGFELS